MPLTIRPGLLGGVTTFDVRNHLDDGFEILEQSFPTPGSKWNRR